MNAPRCAFWVLLGIISLTSFSGSADKARSAEPAGQVRVFKGHEDAVRSVAFSSDGKLAISGSGSGDPYQDLTVRLCSPRGIGTTPSSFGP